jgi:tripartite-type tricarboxylate transporter receptor subunit TctC
MPLLEVREGPRKKSAAWKPNRFSNMRLDFGQDRLAFSARTSSAHEALAASAWQPACKRDFPARAALGSRAENVMLTKRQLLTVCTGAWLANSSIVRAQDYPDRPIRLIVPFPAGGPTDVMARLVAQHLAATLGSVVVENKAGAGGVIGTRSVATAEADGYTLLFAGTSTLAINPAVYRDLRYDPVTSFVPIAMVSTSPFVLVVNPSVPAHSVGELVSYARANPGKVNFGSAGIGTTPHMTAELFKSLTGIDIVHVPYKGGAAAITDVVGGQTQMTFELTAVLLPLIRAGKLRPLAVATEAREADLSEVPTMREAGVPGCLASSWFGVVGPAGTPVRIVEKLNAEINRGLRSAEITASLARLGSRPKIGTPGEFAALIAAEALRWGNVARSLPIAVN